MPWCPPAWNQIVRVHNNGSNLSAPTCRLQPVGSNLAVLLGFGGWGTMHNGRPVQSGICTAALMASADPHSILNFFLPRIAAHPKEEGDWRAQKEGELADLPRCTMHRSWLLSS